MSLRLVHPVEDAGVVASSTTVLAEVTAVVNELRRFVAECRANPSAREQLTAVDLAQAKALLAQARGMLSYARHTAS